MQWIEDVGLHYSKLYQLQQQFVLKVNFNKSIITPNCRITFCGENYLPAEVLFTENTPRASKEKNSSDASRILTHTFPADIDRFLPENAATCNKGVTIDLIPDWKLLKHYFNEDWIFFSKIQATMYNLGAI